MTAETALALARLYDRIADHDGPEREAQLRQLAARDPVSAAEVRSLLDAADRAGNLLAVFGGATPAERAPQGPELLERGRVIGPYRLVELLGKGGMGEVWLAADDRMRRQVALKIFSPAGNDPASRTASQARMLLEARATAQLDHPNVASIYDVGETADGIAYLAMQCCEGGSLADRLLRQAMSLDAALTMGIQLAGALEAAHAAGIIHRDVKPANVLFDGTGTARLGDFGIALRRHESSELNAGLGTLAYTAPEVLGGQPADARADLWGLGATLFEAITGRRAFPDATWASLFYRIVTGQPEMLEHHAAVPADVVQLLGRLLQRDPAARISSAAEVRHELERLREHLRFRQQQAAPPLPMSALIGRDGQLAEALDLLGRSRLLTLTGPGGTGKTRLAIEIATQAGSLADLNCFVPLAALSSATLVPEAIAEALGLSNRAVPAEERVRQYCASTALLVVLDNCEHLPGMAVFISSLLSHSPRLRLLATSRRPLGVEGEREFQVTPLPTPSQGDSPAAIRDSAAVRLFIERAREREPGFGPADAELPAIGLICRRLDGLPLAIELAAARLGSLGLAGLSTRLEISTDWLRSVRRDRPERHQTLADTIGWSYSLLRPDEQRLFRVLSLFADSFSDEAARAMLHGAAPEPDPDALLAALLEQSLIVARASAGHANRFTMLATIREFGREQLDASGERAMALQRHAEWCRALAVAAGASLSGPDQATWQTRLREVRHDLRAAIAWLMEHDPLAAARMAVALHRHWLTSAGYLREIVALLTRLEEHFRAGVGSENATLHAHLLLILGSLAGTIGTHQASVHRYFEASLERYRDAGDQAGMASALNHLGWSALLLGRLEQGTRASAEALELHRRRHDQGGIATSCVNLGWMALSRADFAEAERQFSAALAIHRDTGDRRSLAYAIGHLATLALARGDAAGALSKYRQIENEFEQLGDRLPAATFITRWMWAAHEAMLPGPILSRLERDCLPVLRDIGHGWGLGYVLGVIAELRLASGDAAGARDAAEESLAVRRRGGVRSGEAEAEILLGRIALGDGRRDEAARHLAAGLSHQLQAGERLAVLASVDAVAEWLLDTDPAPALSILSGCDELRQRFGAFRTPRAQGRRDALKAVNRERSTADSRESTVDRRPLTQFGTLAELALRSLAP